MDKDNKTKTDDIQEEDYLEAMNTAAEKYNPPATIPENSERIETDKNRFDEDYEFARTSLKDMYAEGLNAIEHYREVAEETGEPRAVEVLANLIKSTASIAEAVMTNAKNKSSINKEMGIVTPIDRDAISDGGTCNQTNQTIFVGTTNDLMKLLNEEEVEEAEVIEHE